MALRVAVPHAALGEAVAHAGPVAEARERRVNLESYLALDPAIRFLIALALVAAISLLYLVQASSVTELNYAVQGQAVRHTELVRERQALQLQIAQAQALPRIEQIARTRLNMVPMGDQFQYLNVPAESQGAR